MAADVAAFAPAAATGIRPANANASCHLASLRSKLQLALAGLLLGTGPLIAVIVAARMGWTADPNPNPIGLGILAFVSFWPSIAALVAGLALWLGSRRG